MENSRVAAVLDEVADLLELKGGNEFRVRSYRNAARMVRDLSGRVEERVKANEDLSRLPNIGKSMAGKIREVVETGTCRRLEELKEEVPEGMVELLRVPGLGARKAMLIHEALGVSDLEGLRRACEAQQVRELAGMGARSEQKILEGLRTLGTTAGRIGLREALEYAAGLGRLLDAIDAVKRHAVAGSLRRRKETIGDLDILVEARDRQAAAEAITGHEELEEVIGKGREKVSFRLVSGLQVDVRFFDAGAFGAAMLYFTGSKAHGVRLRRIAQDKGWKLNEYGLFDGKRRIAGETEEDMYRRLGMPWIPPELREDRGEVEAALEDALPRLVEARQIRGDLHCHTDATDGSAGLPEMVEAARERGIRYLAITEHSRSVTMAHGLDASRLAQHAARIREIDAEHDDIRVLAGIEVDILKDGGLDLPDSALADLDWVVASVHYNMGQDEETMTRRLVRAIGSGLVSCLGHPLCRLIGRRDPIAFDAERVFRACAEQGVFLEINSQPQRLDLPDTWCRQAKEAGCRFVISTDAHKPEDLDLRDLGAAVARRGWLERDDVANTRTAKAFTKLIGA